MKFIDLLRPSRKRQSAITGAPGPAAPIPTRTVDWRREDGSLMEGIPCFANRGILIPVVPGIFSDFVTAWVLAGTYEMQEASVLDALIEPNEIILEIGAGCGFISAYCAKNANTKAVYCVEANPQLIEVIKLTHHINGVDATVYGEILAKDAGEAEFFVNKDFWASGTDKSLGTMIKVKTASLQERLDALRPTMLIVDIEGGEETLFDGVDLACVRKIMIELHQHVIGRRGVKKVFDVLSAQNFHYETYHSASSVVTFSNVKRR
jgi:FkbM family methyltransferase